MDRVRRRINDKRVLALDQGVPEGRDPAASTATSTRSVTGTPQGGILSPLLANIALSPLDEHFARAWQAMGTASQRDYARDARRGDLPARALRR